MKVCVNGVSAIGWRAAAERQECPSVGQFLCAAVLPQMPVRNVNCQDCGCGYVSIILSASWAKVSMDMLPAEASTIRTLLGSLCENSSCRNLLFGLGLVKSPSSCCI